MGAWPGRCQDITTEDHKHIVDSMVSVPDVDCGDGVFWYVYLYKKCYVDTNGKKALADILITVNLIYRHCDTVHAVEPYQNMTTDSSVLYIPSTPMCPRSSEYLKRQRGTFERGMTPPDFPANDCEEHFDDRATPATLTEEQKLGMGFTPFPETEGVTEGQLKAIREHNSIISE